MDDWAGEARLLRHALHGAGADRRDGGHGPAAAFELGPGPEAMQWLVPDRVVWIGPEAEYYVDGEPRRLLDLLADVPQGMEDEPVAQPVLGETHRLSPAMLRQIEEHDRREAAGG